jgi:AcrR family transcriptional regulator
MPPSTKPGRRPLNSARAEERRAQLLAVGAGHFAVKAYDDVNLDAIADEAGVSHGLIYQYFGNKRGFYEAVLRAAVERATLSAGPAGIPPGATTRERVLAGVSAFADHLEAHEAGYRLIVNGGLGADESVQTIVEEGRALGIATALHALGISRPNAALRLGLRAWVGFLDAAMLQWLETRKPRRDVVLEMVVDVLFAVVASAGYEVDDG